MATESATVQTIRKYADALQQCTAENDVADILKVFLARDRVQACLQQHEVTPESALIWLVELDQQLQSLASEIAGHPELLRWRRSIQPSEKQWWWYATPHRSISQRTRFQAQNSKADLIRLLATGSV